MSFLFGVESPSRNLRSERFACSRFLVNKKSHSNRSSSGEGLPCILACEREKIVDMFCHATGAVSSLRDVINLTVSWITLPLDIVSLRFLFGLYNFIHPRDSLFFNSSTQPCCDVTRCRVARSLSCCSAEMMSVQDAVIILFRK